MPKFGFLNPNQLRRKSWKSAQELAQELYLMATDGSAAQVDRPVVLTPTAQQPALRITRRDPPPPSVRVTPPASVPGNQEAGYRATPDLVSTPARQAVPDRQPPGPAQSVAIAAVGSRAAMELGRHADNTIERIVSQTLVQQVADWSAAKFAQAFGPPSTQPRPPVEINRADDRNRGHDPQQPPSRPRDTPAPVARRASFSTASAESPRPSDRREPIPASRSGIAIADRNLEPGPQTPHSRPVVDVEGPVSFRGSESVQFESPPRVLNRRTGEFDPLLPPGMTDPTNWSWLGFGAQVCKIQTTTACDVSGSNPKPGQGTAILYDYDVDSQQMVPVPIDDDGTVNVVNLMQFPLNNVMGMAIKWGETYVVFPIGLCFTAKAPGGGIAQNSRGACVMTAEYGGLTADVYNDLPNVGGGNIVVCMADIGGRAKVISEACPRA